MKPDSLTSLPADVLWVGDDDPDYTVSGLVHCVRIPPDASTTNRVPAVVMVHGWGGHEGIMWIFSRAVPDGVALITPRAPIALGNGGFVWFDREWSPPKAGDADFEVADTDNFFDGLDSLDNFIGSLPDIYPIDPQRLVLVGFSQGAVMIGSLVRQRPGCALGVASLAGFLPSVARLPSGGNALQGLPVFIAHGSNDDIVPLALARRARDRYTGLGASVDYGEYPVAHKMNAQGMKDLGAWIARLLQQSGA